MKRETENFAIVAQNQSIITNLVKSKINRSEGHLLCRLFKKTKENESIDYIVTVCSKDCSERVKKETQQRK